MKSSKVGDFCGVAILCRHGRERLWVRSLAGRLEESLGRPVELRVVGSQQGSDRQPDEALGRKVPGSLAPDLVGWFSTAATEHLSSADMPGWLLIDATDEELGENDRLTGSMVLTPRFNAQKGAKGLMSALAAGGTPYVSLTLNKAGESREILGARVAVPVRDPVSAALNTVYARLVTLIDAAVRHLLLGRPLPLTGPSCTRDVVQLPQRHAPTVMAKAKAWARSTGLRMAGHVVRTADWTIGFRRADAQPIARIDLNPETFFLIPCDYRRFYADPMIFRHKDVTYIFFEDYDYAAGLGSLSCVTAEADGRTSEPVEVMKRASHLSYPFIFSHSGDIYMIPETGADRQVELWRAARFPSEWELSKVLLKDVEAVDATVKYDSDRNRWWMFVSVAEPGGCTYDTLSIFFSDDLEGEWKAHPLNPVKLDPSCSRPAGPIVEERGEWLRPAQDCSRRYGGSLAWCRITELTPETFREEVIQHWLPPQGYRGLHTFTRADGWEAIDVQRRRWRWMPDGLFG